MARVVMSSTPDSHKDARILHYLEGLPWGEKSAAIRDALHAHLGSGGVALEHVYQAVRDLERRIGTRVVLVQGGIGANRPHEPDDEPADIASHLDSLGL